MTITELIERLEELREEHGDLSVGAVIQPHYPMCARIQRVVPSDGAIAIAVEDPHGYANDNVFIGDDEC